jgi:hypothetical protein
MLDETEFECVVDLLTQDDDDRDDDGGDKGDEQTVVNSSGTARRERRTGWGDRSGGESWGPFEALRANHGTDVLPPGLLNPRS